MDSADGRSGKYAAADVHYPASGGARSALVLSGDPAFAQIRGSTTAFVPYAAPYRPGRFLER